ncbi:MAG: DUF1573 domain-containing protein [Bacteroides sp.]|nr:DUF1573 domain-containing protein [Bacteroides sp.]MCM1413636.1 DUF1573 domain-containing protein [Bacteroides sp.]MCM1471147.1 DUF1573 domain-containing protein [Bacteroides sp.]
MRKTITSLSLLVAAVCQAAPQLVWLNPTHDFGAFHEEMGKVTCTFMAVNTGDEPVVVVDARANCGCTRPVYDRAPVAPGDTLRVSVSYDPSGRPGRFHKQVKVATNTETTAVLNIRGTVIGSPSTLNSRYPQTVGPYRYSSSIVPFGETVKGHVLAAAVNIYNPTDQPIEPAVDSVPAVFNMMFKPTVIMPGDQGILSITAYTDRLDDWGVIEDSFVLIPDKNHPADRARLQTVMIVNQDFSKLTDEERNNAPKAALSESTLDFGRISLTGGGVTRRLTVRNDGASTMLLRRVYSPEKGVSVRVSADKVKPGKEAVITVTVNPAKLAGESMLNGRLTIIVNDPADHTRIVRLVGEIVP